MLALTWSAPQAAEPAGLLRDFGRGFLVIESSAQRCIFLDVYVATNRRQWQQGLMHVRSMPLYEGMIFLYPEEREITMWMKNTYIPLDMVFAGSDNRVAHLHYDAVPHSEAVISSVAQVNQVLELNAGAIKAFGIQPGDRLLLSAD
ncbi:MAG: DUF192 domain-containing protein [Gammaproteobacteria bacterium]|jgi:uncharacterized membrane protein (UPF0127 family)|nr:DUF192 domain-containing protein [Gammaproteobacteria bacterium]